MLSAASPDNRTRWDASIIKSHHTSQLTFPSSKLSADSIPSRSFGPSPAAGIGSVWGGWWALALWSVSDTFSLTSFFPLWGSGHLGGLCNVVALTALMHRFAVRPKPLLLLKAIMLRCQMFLEESMSSFPDWVCFSSVEAGPCYSDEKKVLLNTIPQCSWWRMYYESTFPSLSQFSLTLRLKLRLQHWAHAMCSSWLCVEKLKHYKEALLDLFLTYYDITSCTKLADVRT